MVASLDFTSPPQHNASLIAAVDDHRRAYLANTN
jgi:hypothetical protein